ncbi:MAG: prolipoprotein diacylglyceryl transferase [Eubacterium sp.]|nr:prolipoprotein diacylglyceryl transferase [Eubacterium sp.]
MNGIYFPGLGISFDNVPKGFHIGSFFLPLYAVVITTGFILAYFVSLKEAKRTGQDDETYLDFFIAMVLPSIIGARIYYIIFNLDRFVADGKSFGQTLLDMVNIRNGGLGIYGGLIVGTITALIFCRVKKVRLPLLADTVTMGVLIGQILGRWGNFFNRECFGAYTSSVFRMAIPEGYYNTSFYNEMVRDGIITSQMQANTEMVNGVSCITVHPTFIYEGLWNLMLLVIIFFYRKHKKFDGELAMLYVAGYGVGRFIVEALRTDSLMIGSFKISQVVAILCIIIAVAVIIYNRVRISRIPVSNVGKAAISHDESGKEMEKNTTIQEKNGGEVGKDTTSQEKSYK